MLCRAEVDQAKYLADQMMTDTLGLEIRMTRVGWCFFSFIMTIYYIV